jgi:hypothetical protein
VRTIKVPTSRTLRWKRSNASDNVAAGSIQRRRKHLVEITMYAPHTDGDPKRIREQYREAGVHRLVFVNDSPMPATCERQLEDLAKAWIG